MKKTMIASVVLAVTATGCAADQDSTQRTQVSADEVEYSVEVNEGELPQIELLPVEEGGLSLASCPAGDKECVRDENEKLRDMLVLAGEKIKAGIHNGNNIYAAGVSWTNVNSQSASRCVKVQIQERKGGKLIVKETLVPEGQAEECRPDSTRGLTWATMGIFAKVAGNNYVAGIGVGAVLYAKPYVVGCAAGAIGIASETLSVAAGTAGAFCTQIYDSATGKVY